MQRVFLRIHTRRIPEDQCWLHWVLLPERREGSGGLRLGRGRAKDTEQPSIIIPDLYVGRNHAEVWAEQNRVGITNLSHRNSVRFSNNGILRTGETASLEIGTTFIIGETVVGTVSKALTWFTSASTSVKIAETISESGQFDEMPILGDALEEAGCSDEDVLNHCREATSHGPDCWVLRLLTSQGTTFHDSRF